MFPTRAVEKIKTHVLRSVNFFVNNINSQLDATITNFIDNYSHLNMFRAIISPVLRPAGSIVGASHHKL